MRNVGKEDPMKPPNPDLTPLLNTVFKPTPTPYLDELTRIAMRWNEIDTKEANHAKLARKSKT